MMSTVIGPADEFWRLRLMRVDAVDELDLEWRDDVLYRDAPSAAAGEGSMWRVEAVRVDDETSWLLGAFEEEQDARDFLEAANEDLRDMTAKQFQERHCGDEATGAAR